MQHTIFITITCWIYKKYNMKQKRSRVCSYFFRKIQGFWFAMKRSPPLWSTGYVNLGIMHAGDDGVRLQWTLFFCVRWKQFNPPMLHPWPWRREWKNVFYQLHCLILWMNSGMGTAVSINERLDSPWYWFSDGSWHWFSTHHAMTFHPVSSTLFLFDSKIWITLKKALHATMWFMHSNH